MRLGGEPESGNFEDRTGQSGGFSLGGGGGIFGLSVPDRASRFGIVGIFILGLGYCALTSLGGLGGGGTIGGKEGPSRLDAETRSFMSPHARVDRTDLGRDIPEGGRHLHADHDGRLLEQQRVGCGAAQAAMGPFYCPTDKKILHRSAILCRAEAALWCAGRFRGGLRDRA